MKKRTRLITTALVLVLTLAAIVLTSSASDKKKKTIPLPGPTCCKKTETKCTPGNRRSGSGELIMDNMSRQFISITTFTY